MSVEARTKLVAGCRIALHADRGLQPIQVPCHHWRLVEVVSSRDEQLAQARLEQPGCMPLERSWVAARWEEVM